VKEQAHVQIECACDRPANPLPGGLPATCADCNPSLESPRRHRTQPLPPSRPVARLPRRTVIVPTCSLQIPVRGRHAHAHIGTITRSEQSEFGTRSRVTAGQPQGTQRARPICRSGWLVPSSSDDACSRASRVASRSRSGSLSRQLLPPVGEVATHRIRRHVWPCHGSVPALLAIASVLSRHIDDAPEVVELSVIGVMFSATDLGRPGQALRPQLAQAAHHPAPLVPRCRVAGGCRR
jgi:hypothetical protein